MKTGNPERWRNWARTLGTRAITRRRNPLAMAFVRPARMLSFASIHRSILHRHSHAGGTIWLQPRFRLALTLQTHLFQRFSQGAMPGGMTAAAARNSDVANAAQRQEFRRVAAQPERAATQRMMRDIVERTRRVEERVALRTLLASRATAPADAPSGPPRNLTNRTAEEWWKSDPVTPAIRQQAALPAVSVEQITDNVLRQLDRRVGAWRERSGRM